MTDFKEDPQKGQFGLVAETVRYKAVMPPPKDPQEQPTPSENRDGRRQ